MYLSTYQRQLIHGQGMKNILKTSTIVIRVLCPITRDYAFLMESISYIYQLP
jgi:hypothetical protein